MFTPEKLRAWRLNLGWSQVRMAQLLSVSAVSIGAWEKGNYSPSEPMLARILERTHNLDTSRDYVTNSNSTGGRVAEAASTDIVQVLAGVSVQSASRPIPARSFPSILSVVGRLHQYDGFTAWFAFDSRSEAQEWVDSHTINGLLADPFGIIADDIHVHIIDIPLFKLVSDVNLFAPNGTVGNVVDAISPESGS